MVQMSKTVASKTSAKEDNKQQFMFDIGFWELFLIFMLLTICCRTRQAAYNSMGTWVDGLANFRDIF
jgi:hypothetical protein